MSIGGQFRELGRFLDACEDGPWVIERVVVDDGPEADGDGGDGDLSVDIEVVHAPRDGDGSDRTLSLSSPRVDEDGTLRFALQDADTLVPTGEYDVDVEPTGATVESDGTITTMLRANVPPTDVDSFEPSHRRKERPGRGTDRREAERTETSGDDPTRADSNRGTDESTGRRRDRDLPPFKDPDLLQSIFESHDTFAEMAEAIDMDVTAETVRRYMIDYGIHEPKRYKTGGRADSAATEGDRKSTDDEASDAGVESGSEGGTGDGDVSRTDTGDAAVASTSDPATPEEPVVLSDGIGLPEDVTVEALIDTVKRSNTLYEVTRDIDIDREHALEMLEELDLLDLVVGRLATEGDRDLEREEIVERLRQVSAAA